MGYKRLNKVELGKYGEDLAAEYLEKNGLRIVERNFRCPRGEIDIIAKDRQVLVFIEVRARTGGRDGSAEESIDYRKLARLKLLSSHYLMARRYKELPLIRIDAVTVYFTEQGKEINWLKNITS
ncbi:MAG: YraN family protein [Desulfitobacteriia bacterium]|jgi:putative endonuclease